MLLSMPSLVTESAPKALEIVGGLIAPMCSAKVSINRNALLNAGLDGLHHAPVVDGVLQSIALAGAGRQADVQIELHRLRQMALPGIHADHQV